MIFTRLLEDRQILDQVSSVLVNLVHRFWGTKGKTLLLGRELLLL